MKRQYLSLIREYLTFFPCVVLVGARQTGKSTLIQQITSADKRPIFDLESTADYAQIANDPALFFRLQGAQSIAIDEAQLLPDLFPALRVAIDQDRENTGKYLLSGSSSPELLTSISESLAGRVGIIEIAPFSFSETQQRERPFIASLLESDDGLTLLAELTAEHRAENMDNAIQRYWFEGGYPEPWLKNNVRFHDVWYEQYLKTYVERDIARLFPGLNPVRFRRFVEILAGCSGNIINLSNIARILDVSQPTVKDYFRIAHGTFIWRTLPAYYKNTSKRMIKHPRGYLRDTGLLHHILQIPSHRRLFVHPQMGASWEGLVIEEILRSLNAFGINHRAYYFRTSSGAEVDLILEGKFGLIPIEIKHTQSVNSRQLRPIKDFIADFDCPFGLVINNDEKVRQYDGRLFGVPFSQM